MKEINLKTLCIAIQAVQYRIESLASELNGNGSPDYQQNIQIDLYDHEMAADVLKELYIEKQKEVINFSAMINSYKGELIKFQNAAQPRYLRFRNG